MATTPEGKVKKAMTKGLDELGAYWFFPATHGYGRSGVPDIIACIDGNFWAFECKANGNKTTALQDAEMEKIRQADGIACVVESVEAAEQILRQVEWAIGRKRERSNGTATKNRGSKTVSRLRAGE